MPSNAPRRVRVAVPATETSPWQLVNKEATVVAIPGTSMKVQATCSFPDVILSDNAYATSNAAAFDWDAGTVTAITSQQVRNVTAVRFVAVAGAGVGEIAT